jgi:hypothetical protein
VRPAPPAPEQQPQGWHPKHTTFTTSPINPELYAIPTAIYEITQHPTNHNEILLHAPDGRLITTITKARLQKLTNLYNPTDTNTPLPEAIAILTHRHTTIDPTRTQPIETKIYKPHKLYPEETNNGMWQIPDNIYDALNACFNIKKVIHCNPIILPLRAKEYFSHDPKDAAFGALPYTKLAWSGTSLALPEYKAEKLKTALEQAIYNSHAYRHTSPSSQFFFLPN